MGVRRTSRLRLLRGLLLAMLLCGCATAPGSRLVLPAGSGECRLPLRVDNAITEVSAQRRGRSLTAMIDTGASHPFVTEETAVALNLSVARRVLGPARPGQAVGGASMAGMRIGDAEFRRLDLVVASAKSLHEMADLATVVLNLGVFEGHVVELDYPAGILTVSKGARGQPAGVPYRLERGRPEIEIDVGGEKVWAMIDTGCSHPLVVPQRHVLRWRRLPVEWFGTVTVSGRERTSVGRLDGTLSMGRCRVVDPIAMSMEDRSIVGCGLLRHCVVTFDTRTRMVDIHAPRGAIRPAGVCSIGLQWSDDGTIVAVLPGTATAMSGVRVGDRIVRVNGADPAATDYRLRPGDTLMLSLANSRGSVRDVIVTCEELVP